MIKPYLHKYLLALFLVNITLFANEINHIDLSKNRMNIGGQLSIPMSYNRHKEFKLGIIAAPYFGYFVADNWELRFGIMFETHRVFSPIKQHVPPLIYWNASSSLIYYFDTNIFLKPYLGGGLGFKMADLLVFSSQVFFEVPMGILLELNKDFAIDIGIPLRLYASVRSLMETIEFPAAFLGFRYVF